MKRSEINNIMLEADEFIQKFGFKLPPFAYWSASQFKKKKADASEIIRSRCGWDITDYGCGKFHEMGLILFTLRNGKLEHLSRGRGMCYAEKLLVSKKDQISPMHTHIVKAEDIINRGGADLIIEVYGSDEDGKFSSQNGGMIYRDGILTQFAPGEKLRLSPGESVTLMPGDWHAFWGDKGDVLIGEVSTVNDDEHDNIFVDDIGRFAEIEEDEDPLHLLVSDYEHWL